MLGGMRVLTVLSLCGAAFAVRPSGLNQGRALLQSVSFDDTLSTAIDSFLSAAFGLSGSVDLSSILPELTYGLDVQTGSPLPDSITALASFLAQPSIQGLGQVAEDVFNLPDFNLTALQDRLPQINIPSLVSTLQTIVQQPNVSSIIQGGLSNLAQSPVGQALDTPLSALSSLGDNVAEGVDNLFTSFTQNALEAVNDLRGDFGLSPVELPQSFDLSLPDIPTSVSGSGTIPLPDGGNATVSGGIDFTNTLEALQSALGLNISLAVTDVSSLVSAFETGGISGLTAQLETTLAALLSTLLQRATSDSSTVPNIGDFLSNLPGVSGIEDFVSSLTNFNGIDDLPTVENALEKIFSPFCTAPDFEGNKKVPTSFVGKKLELELVPFKCQLDDASKVLACTPAYLQFSIIPEVLTIKHKTGASWSGLECKLQKELGKAKTKEFGGQILSINLKKTVASIFGPVTDAASDVSAAVESTIEAVTSGDLSSLDLPSLVASIEDSISITPQIPEVNFGVSIELAPAAAPQEGMVPTMAPEAAPEGETAPESL